MLSESYVSKLYFKKFFFTLFPAAVLISAIGFIICFTLLDGNFLTAFIILCVLLIIISLTIPAALATSDKKKGKKAYEIFRAEGFTCNFCDTYRQTYVNTSSPFPPHIVLCASYYSKISEHDTADMILKHIKNPDKLDGESRFLYCIEFLTICGKTGDWNKGEKFRTRNIGFLQKYAEKRKDPEYKVNMYIALSLVDCAHQNYADAFTLLNFGYKPYGKNDTNFLDILINAIYIYSKMKDQDNLNTAIDNADTFLSNFTKFDYHWQSQYYKDNIQKAIWGKL